MRILVIDELVPYPPADGGKSRVFNLSRQLSRHHDVSLITLFKLSTGEDSRATYLKIFRARVELVQAINSYNLRAPIACTAGNVEERTSAT